jgi:hypothetical protein
VSLILATARVAAHSMAFSKEKSGAFIAANWRNKKDRCQKRQSVFAPYSFSD